MEFLGAEAWVVMGLLGFGARQKLSLAQEAASCALPLPPLSPGHKSGPVAP